MIAYSNESPLLYLHYKVHKPHLLRLTVWSPSWSDYLLYIDFVYCHQQWVVFQCVCLSISLSVFLGHTPSSIPPFYIELVIKSGYELIPDHQRGQNSSGESVGESLLLDPNSKEINLILFMKPAIAEVF